MGVNSEEECGVDTDSIGNIENSENTKGSQPLGKENVTKSQIISASDSEGSRQLNSRETALSAAVDYDLRNLRVDITDETQPAVNSELKQQETTSSVVEKKVHLKELPILREFMSSKKKALEEKNKGGD